MRKSRLAILIVVIMVNTILAGYIILKTNSLSALDNQLNSGYLEQAKVGHTLALIERNFGYLGFIHHFKNYVIRRESQYFDLAMESHRDIKLNMAKLRSLTSHPDLMENLSIVESTLDTYYDKMLQAREKGRALSVEDLDKWVKVDDDPALNALQSMRSTVIPEMEEILGTTEGHLDNINTYMWIFNVFIFPFMMFATWFILREVKNTSVYAEELGKIFNVSPDGILYIDNEGSILGANKTASDIFGYTNKEFKKLKVEDLIDPKLREKHTSLRSSFQSQQQSRLMSDRRQNIVGKTKSNSDVEVQIAISSTDVGGLPRTVCVIRDMSEHNELKETAELDYLTNLFNRRSIDKIVFNEISRSERQKTPVSLILIDLDNFKLINDKKGHDEGDNVLSQVARFLQEHTRNYDSVCRWGGDEFVIVSPGMSEKDVVNYANRLIDSFKLSPISDGLLNFSIGIATHTPEAPYDATSLFKQADQALYQSKNAGKGRATHVNQMSSSKSHSLKAKIT
ncbi:sensor domain-containing diguanylate cyclase [Vibrio sp. Of14-4]|uniref:sensor domain-containing diguanylate cyclase n=1 Tax=Vibrio sp. Of14-4 TaxID=2724878 RepID=UPI001EF35BB5|nr:sensor domain-containing diguanylate cyclase [Vibrio sp. Of14-4]MCG7491737.1 sensor domain-containing diguanylate cyclase [Vibrio sp. Of14-4]